MIRPNVNPLCPPTICGVKKSPIASTNTKTAALTMPGRLSGNVTRPNWQTFGRVTFPLSLPGIVSAAVFVFVLAIGDFLTPQMVGGQSGFTFGRIIYSQFGFAYNWPFGAALSAILAALVIIAIALGARFGSRLESAAR